MKISISVIDCKISTVSLTHVPFQITITPGFSFFKINCNLAIAESFACKNILSKLVGFHNSSNITILQPALNQGSIANIFLPYSGFVINK
jgi:hypothetical protein